MTSRDAQASYYDLELPDGARTEVWSVLRAVLTPEEALGYVKGCIAARIMRDGRKPDVDRQREAEKIGIEAGMLAEAMQAHLATPDPMVAALDAVDSHDPRECEERVAAMDRMVTFARDERAQAQRMAKEFQEAMRAEVKRAKELERERDEARKTAQDLLMESQSWQLRHREAEAERDRWRASFDRAEADLMSLRKTLEAEREDAVARSVELERVRKELADLRDAYDAEMDFRAEKRRELGAEDGEGFDDFLRRICRELADLRDRYRLRRQSEEPAPLGRRVLCYDEPGRYWRPASGTTLDAGCYWTHQPPAPGEGE